MNSPWGKVEQKAEIADGVVFVSTARHGGFKLDRKRNNKVPLVFRNKGGWYEEDCEWAKVALTFPEMFSAENVNSAHKTAKDYFPDEYEKHFNIVIPTDSSSTKRDRAFKAENQDNFVVSAAWGDWHEKVPQGMVGVFARKQSTGETKYFLVPKEEYAQRNGSFVVNSIHQEVDPIQ